MMRSIWYPIGGLYYSVHPSLGKVLPLYLFILWLTLAYAIPLLFWRKKYIQSHLFALSELLFSGGLTLFIHVHTDLNPLMFMIPTLIVGFLSTQGALKWTAPVFMIAFPSLRGIIGNLQVFETIITAMISSIMFCTGYCIQRIVILSEENRSQLQLIEEKNKLLEEYSKKVEQMTLWEERNRMAQELHDTVGHTFTTAIMGMDAILYTMEHSPEQARQNLSKLAEMTRGGLEEMRNTVHRMAARKEENGIDKMSGICRAFSEHTGVEVGYVPDPQIKLLPNDIQHAFMRCLQESLTNATRHGHATRVQVSVHAADRNIELRIQNNGKPIPHLQFGFGLRTMEQRLKEKGGMLKVESGKTEGVVIRCILPMGHSIREQA